MKRYAVTTSEAGQIGQYASQRAAMVRAREAMAIWPSQSVAVVKDGQEVLFAGQALATAPTADRIRFENWHRDMGHGWTWRSPYYYACDCGEVFGDG